MVVPSIRVKGYVCEVIVVNDCDPNPGICIRSDLKDYQIYLLFIVFKLNAKQQVMKYEEEICVDIGEYNLVVW